MRSIVLIGLGVLIGVAAFGAVWSAEGGGAIEVRVAAERLDDGRFEIGVQQRTDGGDWGEIARPANRFLAPDASSGEVRYSSPVSIDLVTRAERIERAYRAGLVESGRLTGAYFVEAFHADHDPEVLPPLLCLVEPAMVAQRAFCEGVAETFPAGVDLIESDNLLAIADEVERRLLAGDTSQILATSNQVSQIAVLARDHILLNHPDLDWTWVHYRNERLNPLLPGEDDLFYLLSHGGSDHFWVHAGNAARIAAAALEINLRAESFADVGDQADAIRKCVADGAVSIATTLVSPEELAPAIAEARRAGIPVLSYNSGVAAAGEVDASFHIGLDDRRAGELAGQEFNRRGIEGVILCVIHELGNVGLRERCNGLGATYANGDVQTWSYTGAQPSQSLLMRIDEGDVAAVMALSDTVGLDIFHAERSNPRVPLATFGFNLGFAKWVQEGRILFAINDHAEVQTYLGVMGLMLIERLRYDPVRYFNGMSLLIEPQIADAEQMRRVTNTLVPREIRDRYARRVPEGGGSSSDE